jgi:surfeit locus 1 family protein
MLGQLFSRRWFLATLLVIVGVGVNIRLGIWQLDRMAQRQAFNSRVQAQLDAPMLDLGTQIPDASDLSGMEYRAARVQGKYDFANEVALRNQVANNQPGVHLLTPLLIAGSAEYILVDRGWIPQDDFSNGDWSKYAEPGLVEVMGIIRASQNSPDFGQRFDPIPTAGESPLKAWHFANVIAIDQQISYDLLPVYIQQAPDPAWTGLPIRSQPKLELTEGPHLGYAIQWFTFAALLGIGYPFYLRRQETRRQQVHAAERTG